MGRFPCKRTNDPEAEPQSLGRRRKFASYRSWKKRKITPLPRPVWIIAVVPTDVCALGHTSRQAADLADLEHRLVHRQASIAAV